MFNKDIETISKELETDIVKGLSEEKAIEHQEKYGKNSLKEGKKVSLFYGHQQQIRLIWCYMVIMDMIIIVNQFKLII